MASLRAAEDVPEALRPPLSLALARAVPSIPSSGDFIFEPKWDGFRTAILTGTGGSVSLWSRQNKDLTRYFPDLAEAAAEQIPPGCVVDGEALIWTHDRLDFNTLQQRMTTAIKALPALVREHPASFVAFDVLAVAGHDTRDIPLTGRRALLEELARTWSAPLNLSPATTDRDLARRWFEEMSAVGVEGIMAKSAGQKYVGGQRNWFKLKHRDVLDVVCAAVIGPRTEPTAVIAGLPINGRLRIVGRSSPLAAASARALGKYLHPPAGAHPWPEEISQSTLDRFSKKKGTVHLTLVEPIVVEVSADVAWSGRSFRHALRYQRVRPELPPDDVQLPDRLL